MTASGANTLCANATLMDIKQLCDLYNTPVRKAALKKLLTGKRNRLMMVDGLAG